jgi:serine/threonine-protein kinase
VDAAEASIGLPERYDVLGHLADGGMASVWEARDGLLDRHVAVKLLSGPLAGDHDARERFTREARAAARLSHHPHVVTVFDAGERDGHAFLVMALYRGGTVGERMARGPVDRATALRWLEGAASALDAAHAEGVVHRDVKPGNLLLDEADRVAVGDFGIATAAWAASVTQTGIVVGTMAYLSPEQRMGSSATPASDRYALAVVAHELLTGRRPAAEGGHSELPPLAAAVLERGMASDPAERPPSCAALVEDLEHALTTTGDDWMRGAPRAPLPERERGRPRPRARVAGAPPAPPPGPPTQATPPPEPLEPLDAPRPSPERRPRGVPAVAALLVLLLVGAAVVALAAGGGGNDKPSRAGAATAADTAARTTTASRRSATPASTGGAPAGTSAAKAPATTTPAQTQPPTTTPTPASGGTAATQGRQLNDLGKALIDQGNPTAAVPVLQRSIAALEGNPSDLTYAYALFNLAQALRQSGRPAEAVPLLQRRLAVAGSNQPGAVRAELKAALKAMAKAGGKGNGNGGKGKAKGD